MDSFLKRVSQLQVELKAPKGQTNSFGGYRYRSCEDILEAVKPLLQKNGLVLTVSDEMVQAGERYYIKAVATLRDTEGEQRLENAAFAREAGVKKGMDESQITGTASSYARKYALNGLLCIDDTKDADTDDYTKRQRREDTPPAEPETCLCEVCAKEIKDAKNSAGELWPAKDIAVYTKLRFNRQLCLKCMGAAQKAEQTV